MLKLSLALTLFTSVAGSVLTTLPETSKTEKFSATLSKIDTIHSKITPQQRDQITQLFQFIQNQRNRRQFNLNGLSNNRTTFKIPTQIQSPLPFT